MIMMSLIGVLVFCWICMSRWPKSVLVFTLPASCIFFGLGVFTEDPGVSLAAPGLFLSCYVYIGYFLNAEEHWLARTAARQVLYTTIMLLLVVLVAVLFGPLVMLGVLAFMVWVAAMIAYGSTARRSLLFSLLTTLKASMKQNLPLPMALECAAQTRTDQESVMYKQLKNQLIKGYNLVEALRMAWPQCPGHVIGVLQGAERMGRLASGLAAVHKNVMLQEKRKQACELVHPAYPIIVLTALAVIVTGLFRFVIPQFASTIHELTQGELPVITQWLLWFWHIWSGPILAGLGILLGLWTILTLVGWARRGQRPDWINGMLDWFRWHLPFFHRFDRMFALIQLFETLNLCLSAGCTVDQAVEQCLGLEVNHCFRRRLHKWHRAIVQGQSVSAAACDSGLPQAVSWAFDSSINQGNTPEILSMLEQTYSDRYVYHSNLLSLILGPCVIMALAAMVCFVMLAIFLPMVSTITHLIEIYP